MTITPNSPHDFTAVVRDGKTELKRYQYADGIDCSYKRGVGGTERPYVDDILQSIIHKYRVQDVETEQNANDPENLFENVFCDNLTTYTRYPENTLPDLREMRVQDQENRLYGMSNRELCEAVSAHFASHPTQAGQKDLKEQVEQALWWNETSFTEYQRDTMIFQFSRMQIQETTVKASEYDPKLLSLDVMGEKNDSTAYRTDASLIREDDGSVSVMTKCKDGNVVSIGQLKDKFLHNNPMNVDWCNAEVQLTDFSNGKMKNVSVRVVMNSDEMSGDIVNLDNDMLSGIEQNDDLQQ